MMPPDDKEPHAWTVVPLRPLGGGADGAGTSNGGGDRGARSGGDGQTAGGGRGSRPAGDGLAPQATTNGHALEALPNGRRAIQPAFPDGPPLPSSYLRLLPAIYSGDDFAGRFLRIFEDVLDPISVMVDNQPYYFDPLLAPPDLLAWMANWVAVDPHTDWPLPRRRALVAAAAALYRMRGTRAGIKEHVGIYSAGLPLIQERTGGFRLDPDARLGLNTSSGVDRPGIFTVTLAVTDPDALDLDTVRAIIDADKPVDAAYILRVVKLESLAVGVSGTRRR